MSDPISLYLHIPFCKNKCPYCDFYSGRASEPDYNKYTEKMEECIVSWSRKTDRRISTIYFGGGTPSTLGAERLSLLLRTIHTCFCVDTNAEITVEVNPDTGKDFDFRLLRESGFNRVSIGFQTAIEHELKALGRIHTADEASLTVTRAQRAGIHNVSLDLMLGIPYQTIDSLKESIDFCAGCGVKHISCYLLKIEHGTPFYEMQTHLELADDDRQAELYLFAVNYLEELGLHQYEISNFAKDGFESRHNSAYWRCGEYIGIGPSAHSFFEGKRFYYKRSMHDFEENSIVVDGDGGDENEWIMLSLRLKRGLIFREFEEKYHHPLSCHQMKKIGIYTSAGFMKTDEKHTCLTSKGFLVSNAVIAELLSNEI